LQLEQETDDRIAGWNICHVRNDWHRRLRILAGTDHVHDVARRWNQRDAIQGHAHLDDFDRLIARHILGMKMFTCLTKLSITNLPVSCS
jgi:hypothetical protein